MANFFDQFDEQSSGVTAKSGGNFFDAFDPPSEAAAEPGAEVGGNFFDQFTDTAAPKAPEVVGALGQMQTAAEVPLAEGELGKAAEALTDDAAGNFFDTYDWTPSPDDTTPLRVANERVLRALPDVIVGGAKRGIGGVLQQSADSATTAIIAAGRGDWFDAIANVPGLLSRLILPEETEEVRLRKIKEAGAEMSAEGAEQIQSAVPEGMSFWQNAALTAGASLGQQAPLMAAGLATRAPIAVTIGGMSLLTDGQAYSDAIDAGADPATAFRHATVSGVLEGGTEFLPAKAIFKAGTAPFKRLVNFMAAELPGENIAEVGQLVSEWANGLREDVTAQDVVDTMALTSASTLLGGSVQVGAANAAHKVREVIERKMAVRRARPEPRSESNPAPLPSAQPRLPEPTFAEPEGLTPTPYQYGEYTPVNPEYFGALQEQQLREEELREFGEENPPNGTAFPTTPEGADWKKPLQPYRRRNSWATHVHHAGSETQDFLDVARVTGGRKTVGSLGMQPGQRTSVGFDTFSEGMDTMNFAQRLEDYGVKLHELLGNEHTPDDMRGVKQKVVKAERRFRALVESTIKDWQETFLPESKLILSDGTANFLLEGKYLPPGTNGLTFRLDQGYDVIELNGGTYLADFIKQEFGANPYTSAAASLHETIGHEFGHRIFGNELDNAPQHVRQAIYGAYEKAMREVTENPDAPFREFGERWMGQARVSQHFRDLPSSTSVKRYVGAYPGGADYVLSFDEFAADQTARYLAKKVGTGDVAGSFWKKLGKRLKAFYGRAQTTFSPETTFETFLDMAVAGKRLREMRQQMAAQIRQPEHTVQAADRVIGLVGKMQQQGVIPPAPNEPDMPSPEDLRGEIDAYNRGTKLFFSLTQLAKVNQHIEGLQQYLEQVRQWWNTKIVWTARADERLKEWRDLSRAEGERMAKFLFDLTLRSDEAGRKLSTEEFLELAEQHELTDDMIALYDGIEGDMDASLEAIKRVRLRELEQTYVNNPVALQQQTEALNREFAKLQDRNYFPLSRFGQYVVQVKAGRRMTVDGREFDIGEVVSFETFEGKGDARKRHEELKRKHPKDTIVSLGKLSEDAFQLSGMPPQLVTMLKNTLGVKAEEAGADVISLEEFNEMLYKISPARSFTKHLLQRKGTAGFSLDAMRGYADYFSRFANHIARIEHYAPLQEAINSVRQDAGMLFKQGVDSTKRTEIADHMTRHFEYAMNPKNELANLRAVGFMWYLGFLPKSAVVNLTQIPLVAYPHLAAKFGDAKATAELVRAMKASWRMWRKPDSLESDLREALSRGVIDGFLDESLATELAAVAEGGVLQRYTAGTVLGSEAAGRAIRTGSYYGAWMFQQAEKVNRRITFIAAFRLARQSGQAAAEAYITARDAVASTQYEYARWNRAEFMQGKKSIVFLFWQYIQNTVFFAFGGDAGWWRFWMMMLMMGGMAGLPFAENVMDLVNFALKKYGGKAGWQNPEADIQVDMRKFIKDLGVNPDLAMHGFSRYAFGLPQVFAGKSPEWAPEWAGQGDAFRGFDFSGSLSMGNIVPGVEALTSDQDKETRTLRAMEDAGGAALGIPFAIMQAAMDDHPDGFKRWERAMPTAVKSVVKAMTYVAEGGATTRRGSEVIPFDVNDPYHRAELIGQALGATPTRLSQAREGDWATRQAVTYWQTRRELIMQDWTWARMKGDVAAERAAKEVWSKYNSQVPEMGLRISGKDMAASLRSRMKARLMEEKGLPKSPRYRGLYEEVHEGFPNAE